MTRPDEAEIRGLIERWAGAVRAKDIEGVTGLHTDDMVMFDVPPPVVLHGLDAYRDSWPAFFEWQRTAGGTFDVTWLEVTAGPQVAFATALLRCASREALAKDDAARLRLTIGLRKVGGRWRIAHEHHSYPLEENL